MLSLAISDHIFPRFENWGAGRLTKLRAQAVSRGACADVARVIRVPERLRAAAPPGVGKNAELCSILETKSGFVAPVEAQKK